MFAPVHRKTRRRLDEPPANGPPVRRDCSGAIIPPTAREKRLHDPPHVIYESAADMPGARVLWNVRHELFAQGLAKGLTGVEAYRIAGFEISPSASGNASKLANCADVRDRVEYHMRLAADMAGISPQWIAAELRKVAGSQLRKAVKWGPRGVTLRDSDKLDENTAAAVSEVSQSKEGVKLKMHSKLDALTKLGQMHKLFVDRKEFSGLGGDGGAREITPEMSAQEAAEIYADMVRSG